MGEKSDLQQILKELRSTKIELQKTVTDNLNALIGKIDKLDKTIHDTNEKMNTLITTVNDHSKRINKIETTVEELESFKFDYNQFIEYYKTIQSNNAKSSVELVNRVEFLEAEYRRNNVVISGTIETPGEDRSKLANLVNDIFNDVIGFQTSFKPHQVYRRGTQKDNFDRRVVVKLQDSQLKIDLLKQGYKLAGSKIYISPDLTPNQEKARFYLRQFLKENGNGKGKFTSNFVIEIDGKKYKFNDASNKVESQNNDS